MVKYLIVTMVFISVVAKAQESMTFVSVDSITNQYYSKGEWDKLISVGKQAIQQKIDYKKLRQRIGYAYFVEADYYSAQEHYEKALTFDEYDADSNAYLYYCGLNTGNEAYARFHAEKLPKDLQIKLKEEAFKPVAAIDFEYNSKANTSTTRSNPTYLRAGINTQLGYRLSLYQSVSNYRQILDAKLTKQPEYFALFNWSVNSHISIKVAYHYLNTNVDKVRNPGNLLFASFSTKLHRFSFGVDGSLLNDDIGNCKQLGLRAGVMLPGKSNVYFNSSLCGMIEMGGCRTIFSQYAGVRLTKMVWTEGNVTLGNLKNYNDYNALYVYNSDDPTTFRTGLTLFWYIGKSLTLFGNYMYDIKKIEDTQSNYNQYSFSGGIIWKL
jgi:hypothetical protein